MNELLSPAGSIEAFYAAISNGANAIYLGVQKFNARAYANNFSIDELKELVKFAHLRNVKIYVTMNTILYDEELDEAFKMIDELANIHVDGVIIQDLALLNYIANHYDSIKPHISTQMGIDDLYGSILVKKLGATRVVYARETSLETLKNIKDNLDIEIEAFIHGALCVSYSGNCLMSSMIGERSGNRGRCAGCCRQVYSLIDLTNNKKIKVGYLLSMKDLNVAKYIKNMDFIDSFKIEGRMKEPVYVGAVTNFYRKIIDNEKVDFDDINKVFNRTYTKGFMLNESSEDITNIERPNNYGYEIGKVVKINKDTIWIRLFKELNKGDQIRIESNNLFEEISLPINKLFDASFKEVESINKVAIISCHKKVELNAKVYKTKDVKFNDLINESFKQKEYKKLEITFNIYAKVNQKLVLEGIFDNIKVVETSEFKVEKAISSVTSKENIIKQLSKLNDTPYKLNKLNISMDENVFILLKSLNELRRKVIEKIDLIRLNEKVILKEGRQINPITNELKLPSISVEVSNATQYEIVKELGIEHIYFTNKVLRNNPKYIEVASNKEILIGGLGAIEKYKDEDVDLVSDYSLNVSNYISAGILSSLGVKRITLSPEINKDHINYLVSNYYNAFKTYPNLELIVYGKTKLMHTKYCLLKRLGMCGECKKNNFTLKDKFMEFPLMFNNDCSMTILNAKTYNIIDEVNKIKGVNYFRVVFTNESKEEIIKVINSLTKVLNNEEVDKTFDGSTHTRGHFFKNAL